MITLSSDYVQSHSVYCCNIEKHPRHAIVLALIAAGKVADDGRVDWILHRASDAELQALLPTPAPAPTAKSRPVLTSTITARQKAVASILGGLTPEQLARGVARTAAKLDDDEDEADDETVTRLAWLTGDGKTDPAKAKKGLLKEIANGAKKKREDVSARRVSQADLAEHARRADITISQLTEALKAKGYREINDEHGFGLEMPDDGGEAA